MAVSRSLGALVPLLLALAFLPAADAACTFPSYLVGTWKSSRLGVVTFTTSQVTWPSVYTYGAITFGCDSQDGTRYVLKSTATVNVLGNNYELVSCMDQFTELISGVKYLYYTATNSQSDAGNYPVQLNPPGTTPSSATVCNITSFPTGTYDFLIANASVSSSYIQCPNVLLAKFSYTIANSSTTSCSSGSELNVCTTLTRPVANYATCSSHVLFSTAGVLYCIYSMTSGSTTYVTVINNDATVNEAYNYRYACMVVTTSGSTTYMSASPQYCASGQTSTTAPSRGFKYTMTSSYTCVPTTATAASASVAGIAVGVTMSLLVIIAIVILVLWLFYTKRCPCACNKDLPCYCGCGPLLAKLTTSMKCNCPCNCGVQKVQPEMPPDDPTVKNDPSAHAEVVSEGGEGLTATTAEGGCSPMTPRRLPPLDDGAHATNEAQEEPLPPITSESGVGTDDAEAATGEAEVGTDEAEVGTDEAEVGTDEAGVGTEEAGVGPDAPPEENKTDADKTQV